MRQQRSGKMLYAVLSVLLLNGMMAVPRWHVIAAYADNDTGSAAPASSSATPAPANNAPISAGGVAVIDIPASSAQTVQLNIEKARFAQESVGHLMLTAKNIDFKAGSLGGLTADVHEALFETVPVDELRLVTPGFTFNTMELMTNRRFVLDKPINANVNLKITEKNLNNFFNNPKTLEKLENAIARKTGNMKLITFSNPVVKLSGNNHVHLTMAVSLMGNSGGSATGSPVDFEGTLAIRDRKLAITDLTATANQVQFPVDVASVLEKKFNEMIDFQRLGKKSFVIQADTMKMTKNGIEINGQAALTRLEFGG